MKDVDVPALDPLQLGVLRSLADLGSAQGLGWLAVDVSELLGREVGREVVEPILADLLAKGLVGEENTGGTDGRGRWYCSHHGRDALRAYGRSLRGPAPRWSTEAVANAMFEASHAGHELSAQVVTRMLEAAGQPEDSADRREALRCRTVADAAEAFVRGSLRHPSMVQDALVERPRKGAKQLANETFVEHLKAVHELRTTIDRTKPIRLVASGAGAMADD